MTKLRRGCESPRPAARPRDAVVRGRCLRRDRLWSLFFALGIVALQALGFTPVLLLVGLLFLLVALSYAEGTAARPETGGAATFVRRAFNDQLGFLTGWVLLPDYVIVIALAAFFVPHLTGTRSAGTGSWTAR